MMKEISLEGKTTALLTGGATGINLVVDGGISRSFSDIV